MAELPFSFLPGADAPVSGDEALATLQAALERGFDEGDLIVTFPQPGPVGKSWSFDFGVRSFLTGAGGPLPTRGMFTLTGWIEKVVNTARGAHPACPAGFGMPPGDDVIGRPVGYPPADLTERLHAAITAHPRISDVKDVTYEFNDNEEWLACSLTVITDEDERFVITNLLVTQL